MRKSISLLFFLLSCSDNSSEIITKIDGSDNHVLKKKFNKSQLVLEEELLKNDTGYINDGILKLYYETGKTKLIEFYKNGMLDSTILYFYPNGALMQMANTNKGAIMGPVHEYYESGRLKSYLFYTKPTAPNDTTHPKYGIQFQEDGNISASEGHPIISTIPKGNVELDEDSIRLSYFLVPAANSMTSKFLIISTSLGIDSFSSYDIVQPMQLNIVSKTYLNKRKGTTYTGVYLFFDKSSGKLLQSDTVVSIISKKR